jgi:metal-sulfur cluster biosynthetic enzyme
MGKKSAMNVDGVEDVGMGLTFNLSWSIEMASEDVKRALGL